MTKVIYRKSTALEMSVRQLLEGLKLFDGTNLTLISDVDQDTFFMHSCMSGPVGDVNIHGPGERYSLTNIV